MKTVFLFCCVFLFSIVTYGQNRIPLLGEKAPSFTANSTNGEIQFPEDFGDNWKILFSHPRSLTPVCTSEILQLARMQEELESLGIKLAVISTDNVSQHFKWIKSMEEIEQPGIDPVKIKFPIIDDSKAEASRLYGMISEKENSALQGESWVYGMIKEKDNSVNVATSRGVFIIGPDNSIKTIFFYPMNVGRNMEELVRTVKALQMSTHHVLIPANWEPGDDVLMRASPHLDPTVKEDEIQKDYYNIGPIMWYKRIYENQLEQ